MKNISTKKSRHTIVESINEVNSFISINKLNSHLGKYKFEKVAYCYKTETRKNEEAISTKPFYKKYWGRNEEWIYLIVVDDIIIKAGGTSDGLAGRFGSYRAGTQENRKNGTCSVTNYVVHQSILNLLNNGNKVEIWGYKVPEIEVNVDVFGNKNNIKVQIFKTFEHKIFDIIEEIAGSRPILSLNWGDIIW